MGGLCIQPTKRTVPMYSVSAQGDVGERGVGGLIQLTRTHSVSMMHISIVAIPIREIWTEPEKNGLDLVCIVAETRETHFDLE